MNDSWNNIPFKNITEDDYDRGETEIETEEEEEEEVEDKKKW